MSQSSDVAIKVATAAYAVGWQNSWSDYAQHIRRLVLEASQQGADILVFPEYFSMELASLFREEIYQSLERQLDAMQGCLEDFQGLFTRLSQETNTYILAGTFPVKINQDGTDVYVNRAYWCSPDPDEPLQWQDKLMMTRFEREEWLISPGDELKVLSSHFGNVGVNVCYDSEFPKLARRQVEQGADLILVPSCTDTLAGYHRVNIGCRARALENQCVVVQSPTVGRANWSPAIDENMGAACVLGPVDYGFPPDGIIARNSIVHHATRTEWVMADINLAEVRSIRQSGQVTNYSDWDLQQRWS